MTFNSQALNTNECLLGYYHIQLIENECGMVTGWTRTVEKLKKESALSTLHKIEQCLLSKHLQIDLTEERIGQLNKIAMTISNNCQRKKYAKSWYLPQCIFDLIIAPKVSKYKEEVRQTRARIKKTFEATRHVAEQRLLQLQSSCPVIPEKGEVIILTALASELTSTMLSFLPGREKERFGRVNKDQRSAMPCYTMDLAVEFGYQGEEEGSAATYLHNLERAWEYGYKGKDQAEAILYVNHLYNEVKWCFIDDLGGSREIPFIFKKHLVFKDGMNEINFDKTLQKLKKIPINDYFSIIGSAAKELHYSENKLIPLLLSQDFCTPTQDEPLDHRLAAWALYYLVGNNTTESAKRLMELGANPILQFIENLIDSTPVIEIAKYADAAFLEFILKKYPVDFALIQRSFAMVMKNVTDKYIKTIRLLLDYGADPNGFHRCYFSKIEGHTYLMSAALHGNQEIVQLLLNYGANVRQADAFQDTPLHSICGMYYHRHNGWRIGGALQPNAALIPLFLEAGANPNSVDHALRSPLHYAAMNGYLDCVSALLDHPECDVNLRDAQGNTPFDYARQRDDRDVIALMRMMRMGSIEE